MKEHKRSAGAAPGSLAAMPKVPSGSPGAGFRGTQGTGTAMPATQGTQGTGTVAPKARRVQGCG